MARFKFTTLCLLAAVSALMLAAVPGDAAAKGKGICKKITVLPKKGCVTSKDVKDGSLTHLDMNEEAGADFADGFGAFGDVPLQRVVYATVKLTAPRTGGAVVTAYVRMATTTPGHSGGTLECQITKGKGLGSFVTFARRSSVARVSKWAESMLFSTFSTVFEGTSRFNLVCRRIPDSENTFSFSTFLAAEFYP